MSTTLLIKTTTNTLKNAATSFLDTMTGLLTIILRGMICKSPSLLAKI